VVPRALSDVESAGPAPTATTPGFPDAAATGSVDAEAPGTQDGSLVEADLLVEDVSIDGMCGVY
jgi:mycofactocin precursor